MASAVIKFNKTILHSLPRGRWSDGRDGEVTYSDSPASLQAKSLGFFSEQVQPAVVGGRLVVSDASADSPVPGMVKALLADDKDFVVTSQAMASHMFQVQAGQSPSAVMLLALANVNEEPSVVVMKVEHQTRLQVKPTRTDNGTSLVATFLEDLIVGNKADIYKIAVLQSAADGIRARMLDRQNGVAYADYFLHDFLGCDLAIKNEILVKDFVDAAIQFANLPSHSPEKRDRYARAVSAELASADQLLDPDTWATKHLDVEDREKFDQLLPPQVARAAFPKDLTMVRQSVGGVRYLTDTGVWIGFDPSMVDSGVVQFRVDDDGENEIVIRGSIARSQLRKPSRA